MPVTTGMLLAAGAATAGGMAIHKMGKAGKGQSGAPSALPPSVKPVRIGEAAGAGAGERKRVLGRKGRRGAIFAGRRQLQPANVATAGLKKKLGAVA